MLAMDALRQLFTTNPVYLLYDVFVILVHTRRRKNTNNAGNTYSTVYTVNIALKDTICIESKHV